jgi:hypothetical protein
LKGQNAKAACTKIALTAGTIAHTTCGKRNKKHRFSMPILLIAHSNRCFQEDAQLLVIPIFLLNPVKV